MITIWYFPSVRRGWTAKYVYRRPYPPNRNTILALVTFTNWKNRCCLLCVFNTFYVYARRLELKESIFVYVIHLAIELQISSTFSSGIVNFVSLLLHKPFAIESVLYNGICPVALLRAGVQVSATVSYEIQCENHLFCKAIYC